MPARAATAAAAMSTAAALVATLALFGLFVAFRGLHEEPAADDNGGIEEPGSQRDFPAAGGTAKPVVDQRENNEGDEGE